MKKKVISNLLDYLNLRDIGVLEITFALTPMLCGFTFGGLPLSLLMWVVLLVELVIIRKGIKQQSFKPLVVFIVYWVLHEAVYLMVDDVNLNGLIEQLIFFVSVFALFPNLNLSKLKGSLNWVALLAIAGLLFQWSSIARGNMVHQLAIPGLTLDIDIIEKSSLRPSSFFQEPAAYVSFMICPLYFALIDKKYIWAISMILSIFLTTSTTGLLISFIMLGVSFLGSGKVKLSSVIFGGVLIGVLYLALTNLEAFNYGLDKLENTDAESNVRLSQGRYIVSTMETGEYIFGAPFTTPYNYCMAGRATDVIYYGKSVYMPTLWQMILLYGVVGLIIYLNVYLQILKKDRRTLTLIIALCSVLFSSCYFLGVNYIFTLIILLVMVRDRNTRKKIPVKNMVS